MSEQHKIGSQKTNHQSYKGTHLKFLTPDRKLPPLRTTFTRPQNVSLSDLSPFYRKARNPFLQNSSFDLPTVSKAERSGSKTDTFNERYKGDILGSKIERKSEGLVEKSFAEHLIETNASVNQTLNISNEHTASLNDLESVTQTQSLNDRNGESLKNVDIVGIERQIIPENKFDIEKSPLNSSDLVINTNVDDNRLQNKLGEQDFSERQHAHCYMQSYSLNQTSRNLDSDERQRRRRNTPSFCSSCSCEDSLVAQSRCSICDGCSSGSCNSTYSSIEPTHLGPSGDLARNSCHHFDMSATKIDNLLDSHLSFNTLDDCLAKDVSESRGKENSCKLSLSTEQLIFLLLRMVLAKYKRLTDDVAMERTSNKSQRQSIAYLIQAVLVLSRRVKNTSDQWQISQIQLQAIQTDYTRIKKQNRKIMAVCCCLVIINVCRIPAIKQRIFKLVKIFGFVENMRKINRMRKMIAENWRNIPSLLTDFWRIFIFRSTTRLKNS